MSKYINYFWYFIGASWIILVLTVVSAIFAPIPWYYLRAPVYRKVMFEVAKQIGYSPDDAILQGSENIDCISGIFPCPCHQFIVFPIEQDLLGFQQQLDASGLFSPLSRMNNGEAELFDYLGKTSDIILKVDGLEATWEYFRAQEKRFDSFRWVYADQYRWRTHSIEFYGIGESNIPLHLFGEPFLGNFFVIDTDMGNYPSWACRSEANVIKKR